MPLTIEQQKAIAPLRAHLANSPFSFGTAESVDQRAERRPANLPEDVIVRVEIAPPSAHPHPLLSNTGALKTPERIPIYFYALRNDHVKPDVKNTRVIFFIHGGGNVVGHPTEATFVPFYTEFLRVYASHAGDGAKCVLIAPSYRLATVPENTFPAALQDLVAAYDYVLAQGYDASNIVIAGDSAGANHSIVLTYLVVESDRAPPRGAVSIAPNALKNFDELSEQAKANVHTDILNIPLSEKLTQLYVGDSGVPQADPLVTCAYIPFAATWPKTLVLVGTGDLIIDGSRELAKRISARNLAVELVEYEDIPHGWWTMPQVFPEEFRDTVQKIAQFVL